MYNKIISKIKCIPDNIIILTARIGLGAFFIRAGQTKVDGFSITDSARYLFAEEYKVPLLSPEIAVWMAAGAEHIFGVLLIIGLATRLSAGGLLAMTLVIQFFVYPASWPDHLLWASVLLLIISRGPGRYSIDHKIFNSTKTSSHK